MNKKIFRLRDYEKVWEEENGLSPLGTAARLLNRHPANIVRDLYKYDIRKFYIDSENSKPLMSYNDYIFLKEKI